MPSLLEQYRISDFLDWHTQHRLELNPHFQRGSVWSPAARTFLIDTILRQLPIPKVYLRTKVDVATKQSIREVVDGQQRLRAILDFAQDRFVLSTRAGEFSGLRYSTLGEDLQERFLSYPIAVDQLLNASDDDVLEVFARLNSYSVRLNAPEIRHARFQGDFKWAVRAASRKWAVLWERCRIFTVRERLRMLDDSLTAEMLGILKDGVSDGGQTRINSLYRRLDPIFESDDESLPHLDQVLGFLSDNLADEITGTALARPPHFLMLYAALAHTVVGIPAGELGDLLPERLPFVDLAVARNNLQELATLIDLGEPPQQHEPFWSASTSSTQRIASRRIRFPYYFRALTAEDI